MSKDKVTKLIMKIAKSGRKIMKKLNKKIVLIVVAVLIVLSCFVGAVGLGIYKLNWDNKYIDVVIKIIPYPAAKVNSSVITYYDWKEEVKAVLNLTQKRNDSATLLEVQDDVLTKLVNQTILERLARKLKVKVTEEDINQQVDKMIEEVGTKAELEKNIEELFGWNLYTFKKRIVYVDVLGQNVFTAIADNEELWSDAEEKAQGVLTELTNEEKSFEALALEYSDDTGSAATGGDLGWFTRGVMDETFETAVFAMQPGDVSELVKTDYGYHIITVLEREEASAEGVSDEEVTEERVKAAHILISVKNYNDYFQEYQSKLKIKRFVGPKYE